MVSVISALGQIYPIGGPKWLWSSKGGRDCWEAIGLWAPSWFAPEKNLKSSPWANETFLKLGRGTGTEDKL